MRVIEVVDGCKTCAKCKQVLPLDNFHKNPASRNGRAPRCKECTRLYPKPSAYCNNREQRRGQARTLYHFQKASGTLKKRTYKFTATSYAKRMWHTARKTATNKDLAFNLTPEDIIIPERCPILGTPLTFIRGKGHRVHTNASIDRIDSSKGYTKDNIWVISYLANVMKQDATKEQLYAFAAGVMLLHQEGKL